MVFINKSITLVGESCLDTTIYGKGFNYVVEITANDSTLTGFTIKNGYLGIRAYCTNATIQNNLVTGNEIGIILDYHSSNNEILENNVTLNSWYGIWILCSSNNLLRNNSMSANKYNFGIQAQEPSEFIHDIDVSNTVNGKPIYYWIEERDKAVPLDAGYVALVNCTRITVQNLNLTDNGQGVLLAYTANSTIAENNITDNEYGIRLDYSFNNSILGNSIANNWGGIVLFLSSSHNSIFRNNIKNNEEGICLYDSSDNSIYPNSLVNNTRQIYDLSWDSPDVPPSINGWDDGYPSGGNYWSDYVGVDVKSGPNQDLHGSDGIGDTPYVIDANNTDRFPLVKPWNTYFHDIGILNVEASKTVIGQGFPAEVYITVINYGEIVEAISFEIYANETLIGNGQISYLTPMNQTNITFRWNTTGFAKGNYTIWAYAWPAEGETYIADNTLEADKEVCITIPGDVDGDFYVFLYDAVKLLANYGAKEGDPNYNLNYDIDNDGRIFLYDAVILLSHYGQRYP
jgi:parallel beta-helix repeat protein